MSKDFDWNYPGLNWSHFHSLANLLSLRNGGQAEPSSLSDRVLEQGWDVNDNRDGNGVAPSIDTTFAQQISDSGHQRLKRRFLDCLAEVAANKKGGMAVACSAMREGEDGVVVWVSRNEGFLDGDESAFDRLGKALSSLSCNSGDQFEGLLWEEIVLYHQSRIENSYIPDLRASFKAYDAIRRRHDTSTPENSPVTDDALSLLRTLLFDHNIDTSSTLEMHKSLVIAAYNLRRTKDIEELLYSSLNATSKSKSLWLNICLLARLRVAFQIFKDIAITLPSFEKVTIILVPRPPTPKTTSQRPLSLKQTFAILQLNLSPATTKAVLGQNWTNAKIETEFAKRQKQKPNVHAEVQMLMFLNSNGSSTSGIFPYFGCSKLSCFMCDRFIQSYGQFTTRGCHGRLFKPWTVPRVERLLPGHADRTAKALSSVQKEVEKKLKASVEGHIRHERTSVVGRSSVSGERQEERSQRQLQIDRLRMKAERDRVAEMFRRKTENTNNSARPTYSILEEDDCSICERPTTRSCSICNKGFFCSESCQKKRSGGHLFTCSKRPLTTADFLWKSLAEDLIPQEEEVLEDFGFHNVVSAMDMSNLLGLYQGLRLSGKFSAEDLHEWRIGGILVDKIKEHYLTIPESHRGLYFPWFLKNPHVLERPMTKDEMQQRIIATFYDKAKPYLDIEDRDKTARELKPEAKGTSYNLLAAMLLRMSPNPVELNYYSFGFVTCRSNNEESVLVDIYQLLLTESDGSFFYNFHNRRRGDIPPATFTQFWKAYEAGTLIQLMDSKGLREMRSRLPCLDAFLSAPPAGPHLSVWHLKQFLEINDPMEHPPVPSVCVDYGFVNCRTFEETCILIEVYAKILASANPLELHQACVAGELFQFASCCVRMEEQWISLMKNPYPLEEVVESEPVPELRPEVGSDSEADKGPVALPALLSRLWGFANG